MQTAKISLFVIFAAGLSACSPQSNGGLDTQIPAADLEAYANISDAQEWRNPKIIIRAEGIEVASPAIPGGRKTVTSAELSSLLVSLPIRAWPYGSVVMASDIGIRRGDLTDEETIRGNHEAVEAVLNDLEVRIEWWPA